ncbi:MAG: DUF4398 domain-containing protein [Xanthomonadaceae bacterium]|nr:DUF4398 domain-containing protein [Xanthomonadaceae bacterium]MDP2184996.1 DUF4398 domain-containing protein [Xanthomonadales bacterium]MDZ4114486.1 DUF4398 domain-containing protein [Xanthomonadaceae bacterium]MDZ4378476.1 DUF4398 domain-containing protein [Xanthomonadaceae bacterium]
MRPRSAEASVPALRETTCSIRSVNTAFDSRRRVEYRQATAISTSPHDPVFPNAHTPNRITLFPIAVLLAGLLALAGCATTLPAPDQALQAAEMAIGNAERDRAPEFAAPEMSEARAKLAAAHDAARNGQMVQARRLAEQSLAGAELASAKADFAQATAINDEMKKVSAPCSR